MPETGMVMDPLLAEVARSEQQRTQRPMVSSSSPFPAPPGGTRAWVQPIPGKYLEAQLQGDVFVTICKKEN